MINDLFIFNRYGVGDHALTHKLVEHAKQLPSSFDPIAPRKYGIKLNKSSCSQ